jgi:hypothetical protein
LLKLGASTVTLYLPGASSVKNIRRRCW